MAAGGHGRSSADARADDDAASARAELLGDAAQRQPLLAAINMAAALLLASGLAGAAPTGTLAAWLGCVALAQAARLEVWRRWRRAVAAGRPPPGLGARLTLVSGLAGAAWGLAGSLLTGAGTPTQQLLVPFALAGMAAGAVPALPAHPPAFHAFVLAALLPYAARLGLADDGAGGSGTMALLTLAYAAGLLALAGRAHRSLRRSVELNVENGRLIRDLEAARRDLERRDERRAAQLEALLATVPISVWFVHDREGRRITGNPQAARQLRLGTAANLSLAADHGERPRHFRLLKDGRELSPEELPLQRAARGEMVRDEEFRVAFDDGTFFDELISAAPVRDAAGALAGAVGAAVDITNRKRAEEALRRSEQRFRDFAAAASDWFWETDAEHRFVWMSENVEELAGVPREWHYGKTRFELMAPDAADPAAVEEHRRVLDAREPFRDLEFLRRGPAGDRWMGTSGVPVFDAAGGFAGYRGVGRDIGAKKRAEEAIRRLAHHDDLTGLPNRNLLQDRLRQALALARRGGWRVGLLLLDLDDFKDVNDTLGHPAGDRLLRGIAERLGGVVRASDTLARLGGDEFAVVQSGPDCSPMGAAGLARRLVEALEQPFRLDGQELHVGASVGVAVAPDDGDDADGLVRRADLALYRAKLEGRGRHRFFEAAMDTEVQARRRLEAELRRAVERGEFVLHYQPQLELATGVPEGVEALVRWRHPERGLVGPGEFVPLAESCGLIRPLGAWVLDEACRQARAWQDEGRPLRVAVNLSPAQLRHAGVPQAIDEALRRHGLHPRWLELEITEGVLLDRADGTAERGLRSLAGAGVLLTLDDFGTGYSSLSHLRRLPVATIKIDRSFVRGIGGDPDDEALVRAIVTLGHSLGKRVVAEGVESEAQLAFLRRLGCDAAQGFLLGRPQEADRLALLPAA